MAALFDCPGKGGAVLKENRHGAIPTQAAERIAEQVAREQALELVEVTLQKLPQGKTLCVYIDKPGGVTLDDCERFHKAIQPMLETVEYDFLEVSSPGVDRPVKTLRDFEKNQNALVEVKLFAPLDGAKTYTGTLHAMDDVSVTLAWEDGSQKTFLRKAVALIKPVIVFEEDEEE